MWTLCISVTFTLLCSLPPSLSYWLLFSSHIGYFLLPYLFFLMTQYVSLESLIGSWMRTCLQNYWQLTSGYTTVENVFPSTINYELCKSSWRGGGPLSTSLFHDKMPMSLKKKFRVCAVDLRCCEFKRIIGRPVMPNSYCSIPFPFPIPASSSSPIFSPLISFVIGPELWRRWSSHCI